MLITNPKDGGIVDSNPAACSFYGYSKDQMKEKKISDINILSKEEVFSEMEKAKTANRHYFIFKHRLFNGEIKDVEVYSGVIKVKGKKLLYSIVHDLTEKKKAEKKLRSAHSELKQIFDISTDGMCVIDKDFNIVRANRAYYELTAGKTKDVHPLKCYEVFKNDYCFTRKCPLVKIIGGSIKVEHEMKLRNIDNREGIYFQTVAVPFRNSEGEVIGALKKIRNITDSKVAQAKINYMAFHDGLTNLPNRVKFNSELSEALKRSRKSNTETAIVFIDLDGFKNVNDTYGHNFGDLLLQEAAKRFQRAVRKTDVVARFGGDEFIILIEGASRVEVKEILERILTEFSDPLLIEGKKATVTVSLGVSQFSQDALSEEELIRLADDAMYQAKQAGKNNYKFATPGRSQDSTVLKICNHEGK